MKQRVYYLDNIKVMLTIQVILFHVAIVFGGEGKFIMSAPTVASPGLKMILTGFLAFSQSYFMGLFFTISSYFSYQSIEKKGKKAFIQGKFKSLFMPMIFYYLVVSPLIFIFKSLTTGQTISLVFNMGAIWFLLVLFILDTCYALFFHSERTIDKKAPSLTLIIVTILLISAVTYIIRIPFPVGYFLPVVGFQPAHMPQYVLAYTIGIGLRKYNWIKHINHEKVLFLIPPLLILMGGVIHLINSTYHDMTYAFGGGNFYSFLYSLFDQTMYIIMLVGLISLFKNRMNVSNPLLSYMSKYSFGAYYSHSFVIVLTVTIMNSFTLPHTFNFMITSVIACLTSFMIAKPISKIKVRSN